MQLVYMYSQGTQTHIHKPTTIAKLNGLIELHESKNWYFAHHVLVLSINRLLKLVTSRN